MGSTKTGRFNDYPGGKREGRPTGPGNDQCEKAIGNIILEEVANCEYYNIHNDVPPNGTNVILRQQLVGGRLAIELGSREVVGFLPTHYNYLRQCMEQGYRYVGVITSSISGTLPNVRIDLGPIT